MDKLCHMRLSGELLNRASTVRALACDVQHTLRRLSACRADCNVQSGVNACWTLVSELDAILTALRETQSVST